MVGSISGSEGLETDMLDSLVVIFKKFNSSNICMCHPGLEPAEEMVGYAFAYIYINQ